MDPVTAIAEGIGAIFNFGTSLGLGQSNFQDTIEFENLPDQISASSVADRKNKANQTVLLIMGGVILLLIIGLIRKK